MNDIRLILVTKPMAHHGLRAGYNVLTQYLDSDHLIRAQTTRLGRFANGLSRRVMRAVTGVEWYGASSLWAELRAAALARTARAAKTVIHIMYGEDLYWTLPYLARGAARVVATFHQPPERFMALSKPEHLRHLDALIALDPNNASFLSSWHPSVHTLALGIDEAYWSPAGPRSADRVLFVGNHLRDFDVLTGVIERMGPRGVPFDIVVPAPRADQLRDLPNATIHTGISDEALRALYRRARVFFLPLKGGSANNAVLQALACGAPVVASDLPGLRSYVRAPAGVFAPLHNVERHVEAIQHLLHDDAQARAASEAAREQGVAMGWTYVAERHRALYRSL